jgi:AcrR family transcriptional regulator
MTRAAYRPAAERRREILEASLEIFRSSEVGGWTAARVAERVCLTPPALFKHFRDKDEIIRAALTLQGERLREWVLTYRPAAPALFTLPLRSP